MDLSCSLFSSTSRRFFSAYLSQIHRRTRARAARFLPAPPLPAPQVLRGCHQSRSSTRKSMVCARAAGPRAKTLLLAPRARQGHVQRREERLRVGNADATAEGRAALTDERAGAMSRCAVARDTEKDDRAPGHLGDASTRARRGTA